MLTWQVARQIIDETMPVPETTSAEAFARHVGGQVLRAGNGKAPRWSHNVADQTPVFANPAGISWGTTCVYHPATRRYLLCVGVHKDTGDWGLYESPHLWGPWRTVAYGNDLPEWTYSPAEKNRPAHLHSFPASWMGADGKTLWCIFDRGDHFNLARCTLRLASH